MSPCYLHFNSVFPKTTKTSATHVIPVARPMNFCRQPEEVNIFDRKCLNKRYVFEKFPLAQAAEERSEIRGSWSQ